MAENNRNPAPEQERLHFLFDQARAASAVALFGALACLGVIYQARPGIWPVTWFAAVCLATGARLLLYRRFFAEDSGNFPPGYWL